MMNYSVSWTSAGVRPAASKPLDPLQNGIAAHRVGQLDEAMTHYVRALHARPQRAVACYNLGVALIDAGLGLTALPFLTRATQLQPTSVVFRYALLFGLLRSERLEQARQLIADSTQRGLPRETLDYWRRWVVECAAGSDPTTLDLVVPSLADTTHEPPDQAPDLPTVSAAQAELQQPFEQALQDYQDGRLDQLIADLDTPLTEHPEWGEGHHLRGLGLLGMERFAEAVAALDQASRLLPGRAELWDHLGIACVRVGDEDGVRRAFEQALTLNPLRAETWNNAADASLSRGQLDAAFQYALQAVRLKPDLHQAHNSLLQAAYKLDAAEQAHGVKPDARSDVLSVAVNVVKAGAHETKQALTLIPMLAQIGQYGAVVAILEELLAQASTEDSPALLSQLFFNQRHDCDWRHWDERLARLVEPIKRAERAVAAPFSALSIPGLTPADLRAAARFRAATYQPWMERAHKLRPATPKAPGSRLRLGYLSADFQEHATAYLTASVFECHDRERFECFAYSSEPDDGGPMRQRLQAAFDHFIDIGALTDFEVAQRMRDDGIDLLIDLKGHTKNNRLGIAALRPSPVQASWLGFPGTLGASFIDYLIVDPIVAPPEQSDYYDEALAYLPDAYAPVDAARVVAAIPTRAEAGLPETGFVFCCFNDSYKITPDVFDCWCDLLKAVPNAVLWLYAKSDGVIDNLRQEAVKRGIAPERVVFARRQPQPEHLARLALADLFLDTQPVNAHTTASDALWMSVPVLTYLGETFASRVAASLLTAAGLPELVTHTLDDYQAQALRLANHPAELAAIKQRLAAARDHAVFFDTARFTRNLEALYQRMWERHMHDLPPAQLAPIQA